MCDKGAMMTYGIVEGLEGGSVEACADADGAGRRDGRCTKVTIVTLIPVVPAFAMLPLQAVTGKNR